ncbi:MAG: class I SAM-dependent methyltransferase [Planctomycetota bacterium]|jgi:predicted O-methyltransferase YrrM
MDGIEKEFYEYCLARNQPYFGTVMYALQGSAVRHAYMQLLIEQECRRSSDRPFNILEIGSWAGGSAITWADAVKRFNNSGGLVLCIDKWEQYFESSQREEPGPYKEMDAALSSGRIFELFMHNIRAAGHDDIVVPFKGWSDNLLPLLARESFAVVFVDGDHAYSSVLKDIENAGPLVSEGGVMCGDDLELQLYQLDVEYAKENMHRDYVTDPRTETKYHPGVSLAVGEFFGEVSAWEGFWAMRKKGAHWQKVELPVTAFPHPAMPKHLAERRANNYLRFGEELYKAGRIAEAEKAFLQAQALAPDSAEVHRALAVAYWKLEGLQKAIGHMQRVSQLGPNGPGMKKTCDRLIEGPREKANLERQKTAN